MALLKRQIQPLLDKAHDIALKELERMARKAMKQHPELREFVMGMGGYFFNDQDNNHVYPEECEYLYSINDFMMEWDSVLKLSGNAIRFTVDGPIETEW